MAMILSIYSTLLFLAIWQENEAEPNSASF